MNFEIETERLVLRDYNNNDLEDFSLMYDDETFKQFYSETDCSREHLKKLINQFVVESVQKPRIKYNLAVFQREKSRFIGAVGIRLEDDKQASVGCSPHARVSKSGVCP